MGYLHEGHLSLIDIARKNADRVIVTIFVNPTQFGANEDLDRYPVDREGDLSKCEAHGTDLVFWPEPGTIYADDASVSVSESLLSRGLCGSSRPVHFGGVCTVVTILFNLCQPQVAVFGEKDGQQLRIIRRLVRDLHIPVEILSGPTHREADGTAMSSRNANLTPAQRAEAPALKHTLDHLVAAIASGSRSVAELKAEGAAQIERLSEGTLDYLEIVDNETLAPVSSVDAPVMIAIAVRFGGTRLIDNLVTGPSSTL